MAKLKLADGKSGDNALVGGIIKDLRFSRADSIVVIAIPSHDRRKQLLPPGSQFEYATAAMEKFADLFGGATALKTYKGIYKSKTGAYLWDDTILIQSFTSPSKLEDEAILKQVVAFARKMRSALDQEAVMVVFNNVMHFIEAGR